MEGFSLLAKYVLQRFWQHPAANLIRWTLLQSVWQHPAANLIWWTWLAHFSSRGTLLQLSCYRSQEQRRCSDQFPGSEWQVLHEYVHQLSRRQERRYLQRSVREPQRLHGQQLIWRWLLYQFDSRRESEVKKIFTSSFLEIWRNRLHQHRMQFDCLLGLGSDIQVALERQGRKSKRLEDEKQWVRYERQAWECRNNRDAGFWRKRACVVQKNRKRRGWEAKSMKYLPE